VPTQAADILCRHGQVVLNEREAILQELQQFLNRLSGFLVLSASTVPGEYLLPRVMASFHSRYPGVKLEAKNTDSSRACREVLDGRSELGCVGARIEGADLQFHRFAEDELVLLERKDGGSHFYRVDQPRSAGPSAVSGTGVGLRNPDGF